MNIYVGNLPYRVADEDLREMFEKYGEVRFARVIKERETTRSKGFGFVEMDNADQANAAIAALNDFELNGRKLVVNQAREREDRPDRPRGGFRPRRNDN